MQFGFGVSLLRLEKELPAGVAGRGALQLREEKKTNSDVRARCGNV